MKGTVFYLGIICISLFGLGCSSGSSVDSRALDQTRPMENLKQEFVDLRFGMFICYNIMSYGADWGEANYPIKSFNPEALDCNQWAEAAISANMKFGLLTTKHHEGFCLWDSEYTTYDVASTPYQKDIVRQYVDAFRERNLGIGLYYSIWDSTHDIDSAKISGSKLKFIKGQITELLSNYGKVDYFVMDGWFWRMGHHEVPYHEIRELIRQLQPECLVTDHTHLHAPYHLDIPYFEGPFGAFPPEGNQMPSALGHCSLRGNGWFWSPDTPEGMKANDGVEVVLDKLVSCEERYCNFLLNCMPNRDGLLDPIYIRMLESIGNQWEPNLNRPVLPGQGPELDISIPIKNITSTSGNASFLFDGTKIPGGPHTVWVSNTTFPQSIVVELKEAQDVNVLMLVPDHRVKPAPEIALEDGNITSCRTYVSSDGIQYEQVGEQHWEANALYRTVYFPAQRARFIKIEILEVYGQSARIAELDVGRSI